MDWALIVNGVTAVGVVGGFGFALAQMRQNEVRRREERAMDFLRSAQDEKLFEYGRLLSALPDGLDGAAFRRLGPEYTRAATYVQMWSETIGYGVYQRIVPLQTIEDWGGGTLRVVWRKIKPWAEELRRVEGNPKLYEWYEWLVQRLDDANPNSGALVPATVHAARWRP